MLIWELPVRDKSLENHTHSLSTQLEQMIKFFSQ